MRLGRLQTLSAASLTAILRCGKKKSIAIPFLDDNATVPEKREALSQVLLAVAETDPSDAIDSHDVEMLKGFFSKLYAPDGASSFRHMYSEVCEIMYGFLSEGKNVLVEGVPDKAMQLANSIGIVVSEMEKDDAGDGACRGVRKLLDHINLEITRMRYMAKQNKAVMQSIRLNQESASEYKEKIRSLESKNAEQIFNLGSKIESRLKDLQKEYVAILGIFASIIIAFTSGMSFSSSVLQNIDKASIYRISFMVLVIGLLLFLLISVLLTYLGKISNDDGGNGVLKVMKYGTAILSTLIVLVVLARAFDFVSFFPFSFPI